MANNKTLRQMFDESKVTSAQVGVRVNAHSDRNHEATRQTIQEDGDKTRYTAAQVGVRVNAHSDKNHEATRGLVRSESDRIIGAVNAHDGLGFAEGFIAFILALIAAIWVYTSEQGVVLKPVIDQATGNILRHVPDTCMIWVVTVAVFVLVFMIVAGVSRWVRRHLIH